jgi:hypothetical protein
MNTENKIKKWGIPGRVTGGECVLVAEAATREEAIAAFKNNNFDAEDGSWECDPTVDITDEEAIDSVLEEWE